MVFLIEVFSIYWRNTTTATGQELSTEWLMPLVSPLVGISRQDIELGIAMITQSTSWP